jgi:hypothetical protein
MALSLWLLYDIVILNAAASQAKRRISRSPGPARMPNSKLIDVVGFLQQNPGYKSRSRRQQPFDAPHLNGLKLR